MSSKTEISGVNCAVQKLQELEDRIKNDVPGFKDTDLDSIDQIVDALYELENERKESHDELEKETIRSSVLRHKLRILPGQIRDEIMEAVMSARNSNAKVLTDLQDQLASMTQIIDAVTKKSNEYEQENSVLQPERELLKKQHEEIISQLNQRMADKAGMQITLNETRDQVRQANQDIVDLEDGILQLKEDLIQERTEARQEKKRLKKEILETTQKTREQKDQNMIKRRELDHFQERLTDSEGKLETVKKSIERYETSTLRLEEEERQLVAQLTQQRHMNDQSRIKGTEIMNNRIEEERRFKAAEQEFENAIKKFQSDIKAETARKEELGNRKVQVQDEFRDKDVLREEDRKKVEAMDLILQDSKLELNKKAEEVGLMQQEIVDMTQQIESLAESHKTVLAQFNKQIEDYKEQLSKERRDRMEVQAQKDEVSRQLDDLRLETQSFMNNMTSAVHDGKKRHMELSNEGILLQKQLKEDETIVQELERQLTEAQNAYEQMFNSFQMRQNTIESEVMRLEADTVQKTKEREVEKPVFEELEKHFAKRTDEYEGMIKHTVEKKSKKSGLDDQMKRLQRETEMVKAPQVQLRDDIKHKRGMFVSQMKAFAGATRDKEQEILQSGCKLRQVMEENHKFEAAIQKLLADLQEIQKQISDNEHIQEELDRELQKQKQELLKKWESDVMMQEFFATRDKATAEAFDRLLEQANKRENKINSVTERLMEELGVLGDFLNNVSSRRPERAKSKQSARSDTELSRSKEGSERQSRSRSRDKSQPRSSSKSPGRPREKESTTPRREDSRLNLTANKKRLVLPKIV